MWGTLWVSICCYLWRGCAPLLSPFPLPPLATTRLLLNAGCPSLLSHISSISDMRPFSSSSTLQALFNAAVQDYKDKTGLIDHPFARQLETCESVSSITSILQEQAQSFRELREDDGKLMKALNSSVGILCSPSLSFALNGQAS
jgi:hypothetical protein